MACKAPEQMRPKHCKAPETSCGLMCTITSAQSTNTSTPEDLIASRSIHGGAVNSVPLAAKPTCRREHKPFAIDGPTWQSVQVPWRVKLETKALVRQSKNAAGQQAYSAASQLRQQREVCVSGTSSHHSTSCVSLCCIQQPRNRHKWHHTKLTLQMVDSDKSAHAHSASRLLTMCQAGRRRTRTLRHANVVASTRAKSKLPCTR